MHPESMEENDTILYVDPVDPDYWMQEWEVMNNTVSLGIGIPINQQQWVNKIDRNMFTPEGESHTRYYLWARPFVTSMLRSKAYKRLPQNDIDSWIKLKRSEDEQSMDTEPYHEYQDADTPVLKHLWSIDHIQTEIINAMKALFEIVKANVTGMAYDHLVNDLTWERIQDFEFNLSMGRCTLRTQGHKHSDDSISKRSGYQDCSSTDTEPDYSDEQPLEPRKKGNALSKQLLDTYNADILNHDMHYSKEERRVDESQDQQHDQNSSAKCIYFIRSGATGSTM